MSTPDVPATPPIASWRPKRAPLVATLALYLGYLVWVVAVIDGWSRSLARFDSPSMWIVLVIVTITAGWAVLARATTRISLYERELVVHSLRTRRIPLADIADIRIHPTGMVISRHDPHARSVVALGFEKSNLTKWLGRRVRADRIALAILDAASSARA